MCTFSNCGRRSCKWPAYFTTSTVCFSRQCGQQSLFSRHSSCGPVHLIELLLFSYAIQSTWRCCFETLWGKKGTDYLLTLLTISYHRWWGFAGTSQVAIPLCLHKQPPFTKVPSPGTGLAVREVKWRRSRLRWQRWKVFGKPSSRQGSVTSPRPGTSAGAASLLLLRS